MTCAVGCVEVQCLYCAVVHGWGVSVAAETLTICWVFPDGTGVASFRMLWLRGVLPLLGRLGLESDGPGRGGHFFLVFLDGTRVASFDALIMLIRFGAHLPARLWHPQGGLLVVLR